MPTGKLSSGFGAAAGNDPPTPHEVAVVENDRLPGGRRALGTLETHSHLPPDVPIVQRPDGRARGLVAMANLRGDGQRTLESLDGDPIRLIGDQGLNIHVARITNHDGVRRGVERRDVDRAAQSQAEPTTLADRVVREALVLAHDPTGPVHDGAATEGAGNARAQEAAIVVVGDEADLLALGLLGRDEPEGPGLVPHLGLGQCADGKAGRAELRRAERPQEIGLILAGVCAPPEEKAPGTRVARDARVVARGHRGRVPRARPTQERAELDLAIADCARHRRAPGLVLAGEVFDDRALELFRAVEEVVGDTEPPRDLTGIVDRGGRAAAAEALGRIVALVPGPDAQRDAHDVEALLDEQGGGGGGIDPPRETYDDAFGPAL